jgi:hypothetical protein
MEMVIQHAKGLFAPGPVMLTTYRDLTLATIEDVRDVPLIQ